MKYRHNIDDVTPTMVTGREIRTMLGRDVLGSKELTLQVIDVLPEAVSKPGHCHDNCEEVIYVQSGKGDILIDGELVHMVPGDVVYLPRDVPHLTRNRGMAPMRLICVFSTVSLKEGMKGMPDLDYPDTQS